MNSKKINVNLDVEKKEINLLKNYKAKLEEILSRVEKSKEELINSNLDGQTYQKGIEANEYFVKKLNTRISDLAELISKLESSQVIYENYVSSLKNSINGG